MTLIIGALAISIVLIAGAGLAVLYHIAHDPPTP